MAVSIVNNLYPPTVPTYGEPFIINVGENEQKTNGTCIVPFTISKYNTLNDIAMDYVQVTVFKQDTNLSALNMEKYPCGIMLTDCHSEDGQYYIEINSRDLEDPGFQINNFYRVQIRLTKKDTPRPPIDPVTGLQSISQWLKDYEMNFSEWSTVCLVRGILQPILNIQGMQENEEDNPIHWKTSNVHLVGKLYFLASPIVEPSPEVPIGVETTTVNYLPETDYLKEYNIKLYDEDNNLFFDSGTVYTDNYVAVNEINYVIKRIFREGEKYRLEISYLTKVGYTDIKKYYLLMVEEGLERLNVTFSSIEDADKGRIVLRIKNILSNLFTGNLIIRRTEGDTDFTVWEDVAKISIENRELDITWYDYTIQSGKWYRYGVQTEVIKNNNEVYRGILAIYNKDLMVEFEDIFLNADGTQIRIKYNPQISSFQHTISENKIETIGSKYPYIKRNGNMNYKQFSISGLISSYMDSYDAFGQIIGSNNYIFNQNFEGEHIENENSLFSSKREMYGEEVLSLYDLRMEETNSNTLDTVIYEKDFRDKVKEFLYKNNVKLFRSATEGNILVKLMGVTFTPNQSLGRAVWSFNATAYEVDECSIENYDKYNIQLIGSSLEHLDYIDHYIGQIKENIPAGTELINLIEDRCQKYCKKNYKAEVEKLTYLKIEFNDQPYLIKMGESGQNPSPTTILSDDNISGHLIQINGKTIIIKNNNIYELKGDDIEITSLIIPVDSDITLDYELELYQEIDSDKTVSSIFYKKAIGQERGVFDNTKELISILRTKYAETYSDWYQELVSVNGMRIEADEGTIVYIKEEGESDYQKHIIGPTQSLDFYDPKSVLNSVYFYGKHFILANESELLRTNLPLNKIVDSGISAEIEAAIINPQNNNTYLIGPEGEKNRKLYYQNTWYNIDENNNIACPVAAMVDYYCEYAKGNYIGSD